MGRIAVDGNDRRLWGRVRAAQSLCGATPGWSEPLDTRHVTMQTKNMHDDVFGHHGIAAGRLDLAERRIWQLWMVDKGFDPGRAAEHGLQIRKDREGIEVGLHKDEIFDIR